MATVHSCVTLLEANFGWFIIPMNYIYIYRHNLHSSTLRIGFINQLGQLVNCNKYGTSPFSMGKFTICMVMFNLFLVLVLVYSYFWPPWSPRPWVSWVLAVPNGRDFTWKGTQRNSARERTWYLLDKTYDMFFQHNIIVVSRTALPFSTQNACRTGT